MKQPSISLKGHTGSWRKWDDGHNDSTSLIKEKINGEWACQACKKIMPEAINPMILQFGEFYLRVCGGCFIDGGVRLKRRRIKLSMEVNINQEDY